MTIDRLLTGDPSGIYAKMDGESKERYCEVVAELSKRSGKAITAVVDAVMKLASGFPADDRRSHVGYWLVGKGRGQTAQTIGCALPWRWRALDDNGNLLLALYSGSVVLGAVALAVWLLTLLPTTFSPLLYVLCVIPVSIAASHVSMSLCSQIVGKIFKPVRMPRLDFSNGVPDEYRTLLVVPCLLTSRTAVEDLIAKLESLYQSNGHENLTFCLASDFCDADQEVVPADEELLSVLKRGIENLNARHGARFCALHRPRKWNEHDRIWMGWERKRGKLEELNASLMGEVTNVFAFTVGEELVARRPRFVLTLDDDMELPGDGAARLASVLAHPLHLPLRCERTGKVIEGHGVLQPSMYVPLDLARSTRYVRLYSTGLNSVTSKVKPDIYQDLLGQGTFNGKGIYDLETFHRMLHGQMPENQVLSHDMLEGSYVRSALVTDIQLPEEFPSTYVANMARRHRWWRGDWQNTKWLFPTIALSTRRVRNPISALGYWRVIDNARRVLFPGALLATFVLGWFLSVNPVLWTIATTSILFVPIVSSILMNSFQKRRPEQLVFGSAITRANWVLINCFNIAFLVYEGTLATGAMISSSYRMLISRRLLLEWTPSSVVNLKPAPSLSEYYKTMWVSPALAAIVAAVLLISGGEAMFGAAPILLLWAIAPVIAYRISRAPEAAELPQEMDPQRT